MFEITKFRAILKKNKNVFADIINNMNIKALKNNTITFVDHNGNEILAVINDDNIIFNFGDKKSTVVNLPQEDNNGCVKVIDVIKEKRDNGCIIEVIEKNYDFTKESENEKILVDLVSNRYVFDRNISIDDINNFEQLCKMKTTFESHFKPLQKPVGSTRWYTDSPYSTYTKINGEDISYIYDVVNGTDKIYRIYDLYNGIINERNSDDLFSIHLGLLGKEAFAYKELNGINAKENEICGNSKKTLSTQESTLIYDLISKRIGYKNQFDIDDINSIINAITYKNTDTEIAKDSQHEEVDKLDCDEQHKKELKSTKKFDLLITIGSCEHPISIKFEQEYVLDSGETTTEEKLTLEESNESYSKPVALIKKLKRRLKK